MPLGRRNARTLAMEEDNHGLLIHLTVDEAVSYANGLVHLIQRGTATGGSFEFRALADSWTLVNDVPHRRVLDMVVREVSLGVSFPVYAATALSVRWRTRRPPLPEFAAQEFPNSHRRC